MARPLHVILARTLETLMFLLLALSQPGHAQSFVANDYMICMGQQVWETIPQAEAVDVPVDVMPSVVFTEGGCRSDMVFRLSLLEQVESGQALVASVDVESPADPFLPWAPLELDDELQPLTDYVLRVENLDGFGGMIEVGFTTGEGHVQGPAEDPVLHSMSNAWWRDRFVVQRELTAELTPAEDPDNLGVVLLRDADLPELIYAARFAEPERMFVAADLDPEGRHLELCVEAVQLDGSGFVAGSSRVRCSESVRSGCSVGGGAASLGLALSGILALLRRRRR